MELFPIDISISFHNIQKDFFQFMFLAMEVRYDHVLVTRKQTEEIMFGNRAISDLDDPFSGTVMPFGLNRIDPGLGGNLLVQ